MPGKRRKKAAEYREEQDYGRPRTQTLSFSEYYKLYGTTAERDGWKMTNPTGNQIMYVRVASEIRPR